MLDDHVGCQLGPRAGIGAFDVDDGRRDQSAFHAAASFYAEGGLETHPKKEVRRSPVITAWGAETEGDIGWHGPPRHKLAGLAYISAQIGAFGL